MRRDFVELLPADEAVPFELAQGIGQHRVRDAGQGLLQLAEADGVMDAEFVEELRFPFALQLEQQRRDRAVAVIG